MTLLKTKLKSQKGSALVMALVASFILVISAVAAQQHILNTQKGLQFLRLKNMMMQRENLARNLLASPLMYTCTGESGFIDLSRCQLKESEFRSAVEFPVSGCQLSEVFPAGTLCGFRIKDNRINLDPATQTLDLSLEYTGRDFALKSLSTEIRFKIETLAGSGHLLGCPASAPLLKGLNPDGSLRCVELAPLQSRSCVGPGRYIQGLRQNFAAECGQVTRTDVGCAGGDQFIVRMGWLGGDQFSVDCGQKLDPWGVSL